MKKLVRKLALSCAALAVCAATLVSSTFAWYTTNTEVSATSITGASADTGSASVFVSANGGGNWFQKVSANAGENEHDEQLITVESAALSPVALNAGSWVDAKGLPASPTFVSFTLHFKTNPTTEAVKLGIKAVTVENTTGSVKSVDNLIDGSKYSQNVLDALAVQIQSATETELENTGYKLSAGGIVTETGSYSDAPIDDMTAHEYCNAIVDESVSFTTEASTLPYGLVVATLPAAGTAVEVTFNIYLDGADVHCFDACKGQSFKVSFDFIVVEDSE